MAYTPKTQRAQVIVFDTNGTPHDVSADLREAQITLVADSRTGMALVTLENNSAQYDGLFSANCEMTISVFKTGVAPVQVFGGLVVEPKDVKQYGGSGHKRLMLRAQDYSLILQRRLVNTVYQSLNVNDAGFPVALNAPINFQTPSQGGGIVNDLIGNPANYYLSQMSQIPGSSTPVMSTNGVRDIPNIFVKTITFQGTTMFSALSTLAQYANANFFVDSNLDLNFYQVGTVVSPTSISDQFITYIERSRDGTNLANVMSVANPAMLTPDNYQTDTTGIVVASTYNSYWATSFVAKQPDLAAIQLFLSKLWAFEKPFGEPPVNDLTGGLYQDANGYPSQLLQVPFSVSNNEVLTIADGGPTWVSMDFGAGTTTLSPGNTYWIVTNPSGQDVNNQYQWWTAGLPGARGHWAFSTDGQNWQVDQPGLLGKPFAYIESVNAGVLATPYDLTSINKYGIWESVVSYIGQTAGAATSAQQNAWNYGAALLGVGTSNWGQAKVKDFIRMKGIVPDVPVNPGEQVSVVCTDLGVNNLYTAVKVEYHIQGMDSFIVQYELQRFAYV